MKNKFKKCPNCGFELSTINFSANMTEQWRWNDDKWECIAHHSLTNSPNSEVFCPECNKSVGIGKDFGF